MAGEEFQGIVTAIQNFVRSLNSMTSGFGTLLNTIKPGTLLGNPSESAGPLSALSFSTVAALLYQNGLGQVAGINTQTSSYTMAISDQGKIIEMNDASANNLTVPANATVPFPVGTYAYFTQYGAGQTTVVAASGVTIRSASGLLLASQYSTAKIYKRGTNEWVLSGELT